MGNSIRNSHIYNLMIEMATEEDKTFAWDIFKMITNKDHYEFVLAKEGFNFPGPLYIELAFALRWNKENRKIVKDYLDYLEKSDEEFYGRITDVDLGELK